MHEVIADGLPVNPLERHVFKPVYGYEAQPTGPCVICTADVGAPVHQFAKQAMALLSEAEMKDVVSVFVAGSNHPGIPDSTHEMVSQPLNAVFDPDRLQCDMKRDLPTALRDLATAIESGQMVGNLAGFTPWGFNVDCRDERMHLLVKLHLAAEVRKTMILTPEIEVAAR